MSETKPGSDKPKKTFLETLGRYVVGAETTPAIEPKLPAETDEEKAKAEAKRLADEEAAKAAAAKAALTPEQIAADEAKAKAEAEAKAKDEAEAKAKAKAEADAKKAAEKPKVKKSEPLPPVAKEDFAPEEEGKPPEPAPTLAALLGYTPTRAEERYLGDLRAAAELDPKYQGLFDREIDRLKRVQAFTAKWQGEHPEEELSAETPEYRRFLKANPPAIDAEERAEIRDTLVAKRAADSARAAVRSELEPRLRKVDEIEAQPVIRAAEAALERAVLEALPADDPLHEAVAEGGLEAVSAVPIDGPVVAHAVARGKRLVGEFIRLRRGLVEMDPANEYHVFLANMIDESAKIFTEHGGAERVREGRRFVSPREYSRLTPEAKRRHFTFSDEDVVQILGVQAATGATRFLSETRAAWQAREQKLKKVPTPAGATPPAVEPAEPPKPPPPSSPVVAPTPTGGAKAPPPPPRRLHKMLGLARE